MAIDWRFSISQKPKKKKKKKKEREKKKLKGPNINIFSPSLHQCLSLKRPTADTM